MSLQQDNEHLAVVQTLAARFRQDGPFAVSGEEFAAVQAAVRLMSDVPDAPAMPRRPEEAEEAVHAVSGVMWRQLKLLNKIIGRILGDWVEYGPTAAEQRALARVAELDGRWTRDSGTSWVESTIRRIREDERAGVSAATGLAWEAVIEAAEDHRKGRDYKAAHALIMNGLSGPDAPRDKVHALHLAGELALSAGMFREAVDVLTRAIREEERQQKAYYLEGSLTMRAYAFVELGDGASARADIAARRGHADVLDPQCAHADEEVSAAEGEPMGPMRQPRSRRCRGELA